MKKERQKAKKQKDKQKCVTGREDGWMGVNAGLRTACPQSKTIFES